MSIHLIKARTAVVLAAGSFTLAAIGAQAPATNAAAPAKPAASMADLFPDKPVAKGKGFEVKRSRLDEEVTSIRAAAAARSQEIPPEQIVMLERQILDRLVQIQLLLAKASDADKAKGLTNSTRRLEEIRANAGSEEVLNRQLKAVGTTQEQVRAKLADEMTAESVLERELKINVTDEEVKKFYDDNPSKFEQPEAVRVSHILLSTKEASDNAPDPTLRKDLPDDKKKEVREKMEGLLKRARAGEDFTKLAVENSEDPGVRQNKGEYTFTRDDPFVPEFKNAAFALAATNQISDIVTTVFGYHIIKLNEKMPAKKVELAKVSPNIRDYLKSEALKERSQDYRAYIQQLKKDGAVEVLDPKLVIPESPDTNAAPAEAKPQAAPAQGKK